MAQRSITKRVLFRLHWIAGITAGLVLAVVGATGGVIGFEEEILALANPQLRLAKDGRPALPPDRWVAAARAAYPGHVVRSVAWEGDAEPVEVRVAQGKSRGDTIALDPRDGRVLGERRGAAFIAATEKLHRTLAAGPVGKQVVGASTALLILLTLSGIYLRWPRRASSPAAWLKLDFRLKGRGFLWHLHAVTGTWLLLFYLVAAFTGLWWSYGWYREGVNRLAGITTPLRRPQPPATPADAIPPSIDLAWAGFRAAAPDATRASFSPGEPGKPVEIRYQTPSSPHERAWDTLTLDRASGAVLEQEHHADQPAGRRFVQALFPLHAGSFFGTPGRVLMSLASLLLPLFAITGIWLWMLRRRMEARRAGAAPARASPAPRQVQPGRA